MLLSGQAGSGKSTAVEKMELYILSEYTNARAEKGKRVVFLKGFFFENKLFS